MSDGFGWNDGGFDCMAYEAELGISFGDDEQEDFDYEEEIERAKYEAFEEEMREKALKEASEGNNKESQNDEESQWSIPEDIPF